MSHVSVNRMSVSARASRCHGRSPSSALLDVSFVAVPWCASLAVVLNWYNGDVLSSFIHENLEYMLWYAVPLCVALCVRPCAKTLARNHVLLLGMACNLVWFFQYPFDGVSNRHRTEYYDTQALLCALLYHSTYERVRRRIAPEMAPSVPTYQS